MAYEATTRLIPKSIVSIAGSSASVLRVTASSRAYRIGISCVVLPHQLAARTKAFFRDAAGTGSPGRKTVGRDASARRDLSSVVNSRGDSPVHESTSIG